MMDKRVLVLPSAINILNLVNFNIVDNLRRTQTSDFTLPSLYRLAFMVVNNTGEIPVTTTEVEE